MSEAIKSFCVDYYRKKIGNHSEQEIKAKDIKYLESFRKNMNEGMEYYKELLEKPEVKTGITCSSIVGDLERLREE